MTLRQPKNIAVWLLDFLFLWRRRNLLDLTASFTRCVICVNTSITFIALILRLDKKPSKKVNHDFWKMWMLTFSGFSGGHSTHSSTKASRIRPPTSSFPYNFRGHPTQPFQSQISKQRLQNRTKQQNQNQITKIKTS